MRKLVITIIIGALWFLIPGLLFAQSQNNYAKKTPMSSSQNKQTASKDTTANHIDSSHVTKGIMIPNMITPLPVKGKTDTSKSKSTNDNYMKRIPAQQPVEEKQQSVPPK